MLSDHTPYDTRTKQLLAQGIPSLLRILLRWEATEPLHWIALPNEEPHTLHKRADFVIRNEQTNELIQVELQTHADTDMLERCFVYAAPYMAKYRTIPYQYVLHLGKERATYRTEFKNLWHTYRIHVIDMKELPAADFLQSEVPEVVVMAILCAAESPEALVEAVLTRLRALVLDNNRLADYISIADTLSGLRDMKNLIKKRHKKMAFQFDITQSFIYQEGKEQGLEQGITQGITQGIAQGEDRKLLEIVREMYNDGDAIAKIARICHLTEEKVREILNL